MHDSAARAPRGGRERRVSLRKPVVVRRDRRPAYRHSGGLLDGPIGFPKAHPSLPPGERAVRVRTETLAPAIAPGLLASFLVVSAAMSETTPAIRADLAPTGTVRAGVNYGNFILATKDAATGESRGVA